MDWIVVFDEMTGVAIVTTRGVFSVSDHARMVEDIVSRDAWRPGHCILFDHRELDFGGIGFWQMNAARDTHRAYEGRIGDARSAILMKDLADFGSGRQFQLLAEGVVSAELAVFVDEQAAWRWLTAPTPTRDTPESPPSG